MESKLKVSDGSCELLLEGALTIEQAAQLHDVLLQSVTDADSLTINLEKVTGADLSCLQLLCSTCKSCGIENKQLTLIGKNSDVFMQLVHDAGYSRTNKCPLNQDVPCLWIGGTN